MTIVSVALVLVVLILVVGGVLWGLMHVFWWFSPSETPPVPTHTLEIASSPTPPPAAATSPAAPQETPSIAPPPTPSVPPAATPSVTPPAETLVAMLTCSRTEGKAPFDVRLDARASYVRFADGRVLACETGFFCTYQFTIFRDNKYVESLTSETGVLTYRFGRKGLYQIGVYVCLEQVCGEDGVLVTAR